VAALMTLPPDSDPDSDPDSAVDTDPDSDPDPDDGFDFVHFLIHKDEVKAAFAEASNPAEAVDILNARTRRRHQVLGRAGLSLEEYQARTFRALAAEAEAASAELSHGPFPRMTPASKEMRRAIVEFDLRGVPEVAHELVELAGLPRSAADTVIARARLHPNARAVVAAHIAGTPIADIVRATGVPATTAARIIESIGETPIRPKAHEPARRRAREIIRMREQGMSYAEIARRLDVPITTVKNALRRDRRRRLNDRGPAE
jgi:DNA-binding CsgD family transcriptional regulator